jgi:hypothetical protein
VYFNLTKISAVPAYNPKREKAEALLHKAEEGEASWKEIADRLTFLLTDQSQKQPSKTNVQYEKFMRKITR